MNIFKLVGSLFIDTEKADKNLKDTKEKADKTGKSFGDMAKKAGKMAIGVGAAAATVVTGAVKMASKSADAADEIDKMSTRLGLSRKAYQELSFVMGQSGVDINSMQTGMKSLLKNMDGVTEGNKKATENFEKLGVSVTDASGNMRGQEEVLYDVITAFQKMENGSEKSRLAQELLGKQGQELLPLLSAEAGSFEELSQQANDLGLILSDEVIDAGVDVKDGMDAVQKSLGAVATKIGAKVLPVIQSLLDWVIDHMPEIEATVTAVFDAIDWAWTNVLEPAFKAISDFLVDTLWPNVKKVFETFIGPTIDSIFKMIRRVWLLVLKPVFDTIVSVVGGVWDAFQEAFGGLKEFLEPILGWIADTVETVTTALEKLNTALGNVKRSGKEWVEDPDNKLVDNAKKTWDNMKLPGMADGGQTVEPGWSWVGERGPELRYMPKGATVVPLDKATNIGSSRTDELLGQIIELLANQRIELDGREMGRMVRSFA